MVTLSCLIVQANLSTQNEGNGLVKTTLKFIDSFLSNFMTRLFFVFGFHLSVPWVTQWLRTMASETKELQSLKDTGKDSVKTVSIEENVKVHLKGDIHHMRHKELVSPSYGWVDEEERTTQTTVMKTKAKMLNLFSFRSFKLKLYKFLSKYIFFLEKLIVILFVIYDIGVVTFFCILFQGGKTANKVKYDEYCDTNLD